MYFDYGVTKKDNKRKGLYKSIVFTSNSNANDWVLHDGKVEIVDGDYIIFGLREFGFLTAVTFDLLFCEDDVAYIKLLDGEIFVKGGSNGETILGVKADGEARMIEDADISAIRWYKPTNFRNTIMGAIKYQNEMPEEFEPSTSMWNNLIFTLTCENKLVKGKTSLMCANVKVDLIQPVEGYDYDKALNNARNIKKSVGITSEMLEATHARYMDNKEDIDAAFKERQESKSASKKAKKTSIKSKKTKVEDEIDDTGVDDTYYDDDDDFSADYAYDLNFEDDEVSEDDFSDIALGIRIAEATKHNQDFIDDSENL